MCAEGQARPPGQAISKSDAASGRSKEVAVQEGRTGERDFSGGQEACPDRWGTRTGGLDFSGGQEACPRRWGTRTGGLDFSGGQEA